MSQLQRATALQHDDAFALAPIVYTLTIEQPDTHIVQVAMDIPTEGHASLELMMARWSPGFYRLEAYAEKVRNLVAHSTDGEALRVTQSRENRWQIQTNSEPAICVTYDLLCEETTVTTNWVGTDFVVLNGPATFVTLVEQVRRSHEVVLQLPEGMQAMTGLLQVLEQPNRYRAADFDALVDAPFIMGTLEIAPFMVDGRQHVIAAVGNHAHWDGQQAARDLERVVQANIHLWGELPYAQYAFLIVFREGGGGLEHGNSTLITARPSRMQTPEGYPAWLNLASHEFFHTFNVKRLRPIELGPFDYEQSPHTVSLWVVEGLTCYYTDLLLCRAGLWSLGGTLAALSAKITQLQESPGRLAQTLEQSSYDVWNNSLSGINPTSTTVSYYIKGHIVGWLLDTHIRRATADTKSLDDVMRLAYARYGGAHGFTPQQFRETAEEVAGVSLTDWLQRAIASTEELDYSEALMWFGLRFVSPANDLSEARWTLEADEHATDEQRARLVRWSTA